MKVVSYDRARRLPQLEHQRANPMRPQLAEHLIHARVLWHIANPELRSRRGAAAISPIHGSPAVVQGNRLHA